MDNLPLFDDLDMNGQFTMNGYLARAMNQNNMHELFARPIMNSPTRQLSLDNGLFVYFVSIFFLFCF